MLSFIVPQDAANETPILPTEIDWVDSLTNISVSEFLNEVSQAGHLNLGAGSTQALQPLQSLDSFDAAVAAQSHNMEHHPETSAWDGEETRDAFTFRKFVSQKLSTVPMQCGSEPQNFSEPLRESDAMILPFADCGSLEAWRQVYKFRCCCSMTTIKNIEYLCSCIAILAELQPYRIRYSRGSEERFKF